MALIALLLLAGYSFFAASYIEQLGAVNLLPSGASGNATAASFAALQTLYLALSTIPNVLLAVVVFILSLRRRPHEVTSLTNAGTSV